MDYQIKPSSLPQQQLWTIEHAQGVLENAYYIGIPRVEDKVALLALVRQAWQWDKNAMIQYVEILNSEMIYPPDEDESLDHFLITYREQIVGSNGDLLNEPPILRLPYWDFMQILASNKYPYPAKRLAGRMLGNSGKDEQNNYLPYSKEDASQMVNYLRYSIAGGYRSYEFLADTLLFRTGFGNRDEDHESLNRLQNHASDLSQEELLEAIEAYKVCATHGSSYCMMRLSEAYFNGIGFEKNLEQAYIWAKLSHQAYALFLEDALTQAPPDLWVQHMYKTVDTYNEEILSQILQEINREQIELAEATKQAMETKLTWDYETWVRGRDPVPPMP
ncbi:hypothetical protein CUZ56_01338 [Saezia sanguinis]|uniref:Sel1 repeat family protein n=1 Tax=Saezia sanguinis TaxID=1965230 RepID=A0A433SF70_9BURK|nr:hypothetical protein [Saezia sanguinis]RUS67393.1 hypothetical protein CUZ56_01338 [Saezia sanguinis]